MDYKDSAKGYIEKKIYEKPIIRKEETMNFPLEIIIASQTGEKILCRQCSGCHGCR